MVDTGFGQVLVNGTWTATVLYRRMPRPHQGSQAYCVRLALRRGELPNGFFVHDVDLVCANGERYRIRSGFTCDGPGWYEAEVVSWRSLAEFLTAMSLSA